MWTLLVLCSVVSAALSERPTVLVEQGYVAGVYLLSAQDRRYSAFQGIPYARPPLGAARFQEAVTMDAWDGVWSADEPGSECLQFTHTHRDDKHKVRGSEDCLFINVYTPQLPTETKTALDVIVFIHGGAFMFGSGDMFGPRYFMDRDVVFVTFNYRLGILGFLSTEDEVMPGNNGLKDQVLALQWVKNNIAVFGGNPASVTLMGASAGGVSVHLHFMSQLSKGLFHRGISVSGTALCPWTLAESLRSKAELLAVTLGCNANSSHLVVDCLRSRPARKLVGLTRMFQEFLYNPFSPFGPTVEEAGPRAFLSTHPLDAMSTRQMQDLPWITSVTTHEGLYPAAEFLSDDAYLRELQERFEEIAPHLLDFNYTVPVAQHRDVSRKIRAAYLGDQPISRNTIDAVVQMVGDRLFVVDAVLAARLQASINHAPVFFYQFAYRGEDSLSEWLSGDSADYGCAHVDDIGFITQVFYNNPEQTASDRQMTELLLDLFTSFAKDGIPDVSTHHATKWEPVNQRNLGVNHLYIQNSSYVEQKSSTDLGKVNFWLSLDINERRKVQQLGKDEL